MKPLGKKFLAKVDLSEVALEKWRVERMYSQGYRFVGRHSAIKICEWTKRGLKCEGQCYKQEFYEINSHQCVQMSPAVFHCDFNCQHCWRSLGYTLPKEDFKWDDPEEIFEGCVKEQIKAVQGLKGSYKVDLSKFKESQKPKHFAISLSGEPTLYPYLPEFIDTIKKNGMTAFLVTNGAHPEMIKKLIDYQPTNLYMTLHAPDKETFKKECVPMINDGWEKMMETLDLFKEFDCNTVIRLTLNKKINMVNPREYAKLIEKAGPRFVECKGYFPVGGARVKLGPDSMPFFEDILNFAKEIEKNSSYKIVNQMIPSNVILLSK